MFFVPKIVQHYWLVVQVQTFIVFCLFASVNRQKNRSFKVQANKHERHSNLPFSRTRQGKIC